MHGKLKWVVGGIVLLLALVGVQTYREFSALKSIDSYEACAVAKGSRIQESYPATCVTRLGTRFIQPITQPAIQTYSNSILKITLDYPSHLIVGGSSTSLGVSFGAPDTGGLGFEVNMIKNKLINELFSEDKARFAGFLQSSDQSPILESTIVNTYPAKEAVFKNAAYGVDIRSIYFQRGADVINILLPAYEESPANQILSTFKFTN